MKIKLTVLGSGTSSGVPVIGCDCKICQSEDPKNQRLRSSSLFECDDKVILIDTTPDLRFQALRENIKRIDAVLFTHIHADHTHGIDELRLYNAYQKSEIPAFGDKGTISHLEKTFSYIFKPSTTTPYPSLIPRLVGNPIATDKAFDFKGVQILPIPCHHGPKWMTTNYRIGNIAWLTDTSEIPEESYAKLQNLEYLFVDGLRHKPHPTHFHLEKALAAAKRIQAKKTYLIHLAHDYDHHEMNEKLPESIELAYDGLSVQTEI